MRAAPRRAARRCAAPSNQISPASGRIVPVMRLNSVVLPEPFGPISAVIVPSRTANERRRRPAGRRSASRRPCTSSSGPAGLPVRGRPAARSTIAHAACARGGRRPGRCPRFDARRRVEQLVRRVGRIPRGRKSTTSTSSAAEDQQARRCRRRQCTGCCDLVERLDDERAEHRAPQRPAAAEQQRRARSCTLVRMSNMPERVDEGEVVGVDAAGHADRRRRSRRSASILYVGVFTPIAAALSSSSRIAIRPMPNLVRRIQPGDGDREQRGAPGSM